MSLHTPETVEPRWISEDVGSQTGSAGGTRRRRSIALGAGSTFATQGIRLLRIRLRGI